MTLREFIGQQRWTFARNYAAFAPHEYIVRSKVADKETFDAMAEYILKNGMRMFYYKNERRYLFVDGWYYWVMRDSDDDPTAIINRCRPDDYDIVFVRRNTWLESKKAKEECIQLELDLKQMEDK